MLCDDCKKRPASMLITKIVNDQKIEKHLCEQCAKKYGQIVFTVDNNFSVHDFLKGIFNTGFGEGHPEREVSCPQCGMSYRDFSRGGKIGCATCYTTFGDRLIPLLRRIHGASVHTGKVPHRSGKTLTAKRRLQRMRQELKNCVMHEEYEQAAKLRDEIKEIEKNVEE